MVVLYDPLVLRCDRGSVDAVERVLAGGDEMSISVQTDVFCDRCDYSWVYGGPTSNDATPRVARRYARCEGWIRRFNKDKRKWEDICPLCLAEAEQHECAVD